MSVGVVTLTVYTLMWPIMVAVVLTVIGRSFFKEWKEARDEGIPLV